MDITAFLDNLNGFFRAGDRNGAAAYMEKGLTQAEAEGDQNSCITILNELAGFYRATGRYEQGIECAKRAIATIRSIGGNGTAAHGTTLLNAATVYRAAGDMPKALELFMASFAILSVCLPENDSRIAGLLNNMSAVYEYSGRHAEALEALEKAAVILGHNPGMEVDAAIVQANMGQSLFRLGRYDEGEAALERAVALFKPAEKNGKPSPYYAAALAGLAESCLRKGDPSGAVKHYENALAQMEAAFGRNRDYAVLCRNCALAYDKVGNAHKAQEMRARAEGVA